MTKRRLSVAEALALPSKVDPRGYRYVWLGRRHPLARRSGQQWLHRLVAMIRVAVFTPCVVTEILESGKVRVDLGDGVLKVVRAGQLVYSEGASA